MEEYSNADDKVSIIQLKYSVQNTDVYLSSSKTEN